MHTQKGTRRSRTAQMDVPEHAVGRQQDMKATKRTPLPCVTPFPRER